jgi:hypothetical protein
MQLAMHESKDYQKYFFANARVPACLLDFDLDFDSDFDSDTRPRLAVPH